MDERPTILDISLNDLAFRTLNGVPYEPSESLEEAIDDLANMIRRAGLGIMVGLIEIARAIEQHGTDDPG